MSDGYDTLSYVMMAGSILPVIVAWWLYRWFWCDRPLLRPWSREIAPYRAAPQVAVSDHAIWVDHMWNPTRTFVRDRCKTTAYWRNECGGVESVVTRDCRSTRYPNGSIEKRVHTDAPDCGCIHCRKGRTVVRARGPVGVY